MRLEDVCIYDMGNMSKGESPNYSEALSQLLEDAVEIEGLVGRKLILSFTLRVFLDNCLRSFPYSRMRERLPSLREPYAVVPHVRFFEECCSREQRLLIPKQNLAIE